MPGLLHVKCTRKAAEMATTVGRFIGTTLQLCDFTEKKSHQFVSATPGPSHAGSMQKAAETAVVVTRFIAYGPAV